MDKYTYTLTRLGVTAVAETVTNSPDTACPIFEDLERFTHVVNEFITGRSGATKDLPSVSYVRHGLVSILKSIAWRHQTWNPTKQDTMRLAAAVKNLIKKGLVTRDPHRERQWITARITRIMVEALVMDAHTNGTSDWDSTISSWLSLVAQQCFSGRQGDIVRSQGYRGTEFIMFEHLDIRLSSKGQAHERLVMNARIYHEKGSK